jgi:hypothetical protein
MTDLQILALAAFIFVGLPAIVFFVALAIDRLRPSDPLAQMGRKPRKHRAF